MYINENAIFVHDKRTQHHPDLNKKFAVHSACTGKLLCFIQYNYVFLVSFIQFGIVYVIKNKIENFWRVNLKINVFLKNVFVYIKVSLLIT